jgi:protein-tyrosine phosphatase
MATVCLTWQLKIHARTPLQGVITVPQNSVPLCREFEGRGSPLSSHLAILPQKQSQNFRVMVARSISWTKSSNFPALKKTLDRGTCRANLDYNIIDDNLIVGSCPKTKDDISKLSTDEHVTAILNLQQDQDFGPHNVDIGSIKAECSTLGISYYQVPITDGSPGDLRKYLPKAVGVLDNLIRVRKKKVYLHCTAGVGRSPSVAVAYYYWIKRMNLNDAYAFVKSKRPVSHPNTGAIQDATDGLLQRANFEDNLTGADRDKIQDDLRDLGEEGE